MSTQSEKTVKQFTEQYHLGSPFDLDDDKAYQAWRENKLENYPEKVEDLIVEVNDPAALTPAEFDAIQALVVKTNMAVYAGHTGNNPDKEIPATSLH